MGKGIKAGKKKHSENGMIRKAKKEATDAALKQCMVIFLAYMMDEEGYNDPEKLVEMWETFNRWCDALTDPQLLTIHKVEKIIKEHTGIKIDWKDF
ncbi:hypothetical protein ACPA0F_08970 [Solibacillus silvestris]